MTINCWLPLLLLLLHIAVMLIQHRVHAVRGRAGFWCSCCMLGGAGRIRRSRHPSRKGRPTPSSSPRHGRQPRTRGNRKTKLQIC